MAICIEWMTTVLQFLYSWVCINHLRICFPSGRQAGQGIPDQGSRTPQVWPVAICFLKFAQSHGCHSGIHVDGANLRKQQNALHSFHWLKVPERIQFKLATIVCRSLNGTAPRYLDADLRRLSDMPSRRRLRSSLTDQLDVRQSQCSTVGDRAFAVAGARLWNSLPHDIVASDTCHISVVDSKHFYLDSHILLFCFSS